MRHLATPPWETDLFVAGEFTDTVEVYSLDRRVRLAHLNTVLDGGGQRLALVPGNDPLVLAGAWERHGVCAYRFDGGIAWQKKDRSQVQRIEVLGDDLVAVSYERQPTLVLRIGTGREVRSLRGIRDVCAVERDRAVLVGRKTITIADGDLQPISKPVELVGFAVLDAASNGELVAVCEARGPVRLFQPNGNEHARLEVDGGHALHVAFDPESRTWIANTLSFSAGPTWLIRLDDEGSELDRVPFQSMRQACTAEGGRSFVYADESGLQRLDNTNLSHSALAFHS